MLGRNTRVLLVEDNPGLLETFADILRATGMEVDTALDARAAFGLLDEGQYDVAVVDIVLPGPSGIEVILKLKASAPATRIIVCTAYYDGDLLAEAQSLGIDQTIHKPIHPGPLIEIIKKLVALAPGEKPQAPDSQDPRGAGKP